MTNEDLAIKIEDEFRKEDEQNGEPPGDYFADITNWLSEFAGTDHDYDESDVTYLKAEFEMATM